jgi:hypothetical protein
MDAIQRAVLVAEVNAQLDRIGQVYSKLLDRSQKTHFTESAYVESAAYQLHNLYSAVEDLLKIVAGAFENSITDLSRWHRELLDRMTLNIEGVRPAFLSTETAALLHELRAFRHFFRHAYGLELDASRVLKNVEIALRVRDLLTRDAQAFIEAIEPSKPA